MNWLFRRRAARGPAVRTFVKARALGVEALEARDNPATFDFTANAFGGGNFNPFPDFSGTVGSASGDVNADGTADIIVAEGVGAGSGSRVRVFDGAAARFNGQAVLISDFFAYSNVAGAGQAPGFGGGVFVAAADLNGDRFAEVITSPGAGAAGHVKVFDFNAGGGFAFNNPILRTSFFAYPGFAGEVRVAALNQAAGLPLLATVSGAGSTDADLRLYDSAFNIGQVGPGRFVPPLTQTFAFPGYLGGVSIAGGGPGQLFIAPNVNDALVGSFNLTGTTLAPGVTFPTGFVGPTDARLGSADVDGDGIIDVLVSSPNANGLGAISAFSLADGVTTLNALNGFQGFGFFGDSWLSSGAFTGTNVLNPIGGIGGLGGVSGLGFAGGLNQGLPGVGNQLGLSNGAALNSTVFPPIGSRFTPVPTPGFSNSFAPGFGTGFGPGFNTGFGGSQINNGLLAPGIR